MEEVLIDQLAADAAHLRRTPFQMVANLVRVVFCTLNAFCRVSADVEQEEVALHLLHTSFAADVSRDCPFRPHEQGKQVDKHIYDRAQPCNRGIHMHGKRVAERGVCHADEEGEKECVRQMLCKEQCRSSRRDEKRDDENRTDRVECCDRCERGERHKGVEEDARRYTDEPCVFAVKRGDLELLVEHGDKHCNQEGEPAHLERGSGNLHAADPDRVQPCIDDFAHEHHVGIEVGIPRIFADENDGERKKQGKDDTDRIVVFDKARFAEQLDEGHRDNTHERRTEEQPRRAEVMRYEESEHDAEQNGVADCVRHHGETAQDEEYAERCARCRRQQEYEQCIIHVCASVSTRCRGCPLFRK